MSNLNKTTQLLSDGAGIKPRLVVVNRDCFVPPVIFGNIWRLCCWCYWHLVGKNAVKTSYNAEDKPTTKNDLAQNVHSDEVEKSCSYSQPLSSILGKTTSDLRIEGGKL